MTGGRYNSLMNVFLRGIFSRQNYFLGEKSETFSGSDSQILSPNEKKMTQWDLN